MIIVTGASGQLGGAILRALLERVPADQVGVSTRDPAAVPDLVERGLRVRRGDYADPATLADAFEGADQVLLVSSNTVGAQTLAHHRAAIDGAVAAGVGRIVYTSQMAADPASRFAPAVDHAATEEMLRASGVPFTSLRNGFHASSAMLMLGPALATGELRAPADGPIAWTTHADLAEGAAAVLADGGLDGPTPPLTAAEAIDLDRMAELAGEVTGRPVRRVVVSDAEHRAALVAHGTPEPLADMLIGMFEAARAGEFAAVDPTLPTLLGRPPAPFADVVAAARPTAGAH
jgi:NAD(P)H dehydrogenase (quinone)